ncbi:MULTISPECIES: MATE family efflux transporter [Niastella]|uniref:Multidrug-efflux transporter n=1 Tax=Niastella soli TaxID=2821487 RepID=A0ABS3YPX1_9BACT|nr:MATE family efflux transporter [Niastella soli]MBO9199632.1 MATE family efflux transporter [Niastella soli]
MSDQTPNIGTMRIRSVFSLFKLALSDKEQDYTQGSIRRAIFLLAVPMILEMVMESIFALVDIFFVGRLGKSEAVSTVVLTESVLTVVYSLAIGLSMAATAMVARRIGEKNPEAASKAGMQSLLIAFVITVIISATGLIYAPEILKLMGGSSEAIRIGSNYTRIIYGGSVVIMLLFLINGIFRGAGDASMAMRSLWIANICNIILCPLLIYGVGPIPGFGITGAAMATTIGRGIGVLYQLFHLFSGKRVIKVKKQDFIPDWPVIKSISNIAWTGVVQFLIPSGSWIVLNRIMAEFGDTAVAGYGVAIRLIMFFLLPAWGMSNAATTLVGQNLGAQQPQRAEQSVWSTARYNAIFMIFVTLVFLLFAQPIVNFMNRDVAVESYATMALRIISLGYIFYGVGMVVTNAFNGAGDTRTPTLINIFGFWLFQVPLAFVLALVFKLGPKGVFIAIVAAETCNAIASIIIFKKGKWKKVKI